MTSALYERIRYRGNPIAHPESIIVSDQVRFTVLTERIIRLEWSSCGVFEDRATYAFPTRYNDKPSAISTYMQGQNLIIETSQLKVVYVRGSGAFSANNLQITFKLNEDGVTWHPGQPDVGNLRGTRRTLDQCEGDASLEKGLFSKSGWTLFDDSKNVVFSDDGWVAPRPDYEVQDWYFFAFGHDYKGGLAEYALFGGETPLIPYFVLGGWWSRYWAYSENDLRNLVAEFETHGIPLDVFVIDMDWHTPLGWTGYTWNRDLFHDPPAFLAWLHTKGLKTTLNLHPADGVHAHEEVYPTFARALDIDPETKKPVPFQIADKEYVKQYFELLHHPMEDEGVDFWWMDWQQGEISEVKGLDPLPWINHLHFNDIKRRGIRPMLYSRWGGLGNHRYYIGFSGDTYVTWESLQFQPYMTATAANVLYGWWSHDIGGHMGGATDPELYARWVQFGALSPVLRLHSTKDARAERRPWGYSEEVLEAAKAAFLLRYQLIPYLYTMARVASESNITLCRPSYYEHPEDESAYAARYQYYLGDQLIAAPFVFPLNRVNKMASIDVWVPPGIWTAYDTLETFCGPCWVRMVGTIKRMPMLVKSGAIIPLAPQFVNQAAPLLKSGTSSAIPKDNLELIVFPGEGHFEFYEDDGVTEAHTQGQYTWTRYTTSQPEANTWLLKIFPVKGWCEALPTQRRYTIFLKGSAEPTSVTVNSKPALNWRYSEQEKTTTIELFPTDKDKMMLVKAVACENIVLLGDALNEQLISADAVALLGTDCPSDAFDIKAIVELENEAKLDVLSRIGAPFVSFIDYSTPEEATQSLGSVIVACPTDQSEYTAHIVFRVFHKGQVETSTMTLNQTTKAHVIEVPFACQSAELMLWEAEVTLVWRDISWETQHRSKPLFPGVTLWQCLLYHSGQKKDLRDLAMVPGGFERNLVLSWKESQPSLEDAVNFSRCHIAPLKTLYSDLEVTDEDMSVLLTSLVTSPTSRKVKIEFTTNTLVEISLNGKIVKQDEFVNNTALGRFVTGTHFTKAVQLDAGVNILIVDCPGVGNSRARWFLGCAFTTLSGELLVDLLYE